MPLSHDASNLKNIAVLQKQVLIQKNEVFLDYKAYQKGKERDYLSL